MSKRISGYWKANKIVCQPALYADGLSKDVAIGDIVHVVGLAIEFEVCAVEARGAKVIYTPAEGTIVPREAEGKSESEQQMERSFRRHQKQSEVDREINNGLPPIC